MPSQTPQKPLCHNGLRVFIFVNIINFLVRCDAA